jgi:hypothetical protein
LLFVAGAAIVAAIVATAPNEPVGSQPRPASAQSQPAVETVLEDAVLDDGGAGMAREFTPPIHDPAALAELRDAIAVRGPLGLAVLKAEYDRVRLGFRPPRDAILRASRLLYQIGLLDLHEGRYSEAASFFRRSLDVGRPHDFPARERAERMAFLGIAALRRAEAENALAQPGAPSSIFPVPAQGVHTERAGAREAVRRFTEYLETWPGELRVRWLLNLSYMWLGEYPEKVPKPYLIPLDRFAPEHDPGVFENVALQAGLARGGPRAAGGIVFDDFNNDGWPDILTAALDAAAGSALLLNRGDGTFDGGFQRSGLDGQVYARNVTCADIDNDGNLDALLVRGGGEAPMRLSLLRNKGDGTFEDLTLSSGLAAPIASASAAWADYDNDGRIDLFVCGEYRFGAKSDGAAGSKPDQRNLCRLYRNLGACRFVDVAGTAGVANERCAQAAAWGDYDDDGRQDLFVSNRGAPYRLYHNEGNGTFRDIAPALGLAGAGADAHSVCWFWDFDNDGRLDIFVANNQASLAETVAFAMSLSHDSVGHPHLYHNQGPDGFRDVARESGLDRPIATSGANFGDIDNDGYLDLYLGTGWFSFSGLVPDLLFKNAKGQRFLDVTLAAGTGSLGDASGVALADYDDDGNLDILVQTGGPVAVDRTCALLFRNPGHGTHWLKLKLIGTRSNSAAIGARIRAEFRLHDGQMRSVFRTIGHTSSSGGNSLVESLGTGAATTIERLSVTWPASGTTQSFRDLATDQVIEITEGAAAYRSLRRRKPGDIPAQRHAGRRAD